MCHSWWCECSYVCATEYVDAWWLLFMSHFCSFNCSEICVAFCADFTMSATVGQHGVLPLEQRAAASLSTNWGPRSHRYIHYFSLFFFSLLCILQFKAWKNYCFKRLTPCWRFFQTRFVPLFAGCALLHAVHYHRQIGVTYKPSMSLLWLFFSDGNVAVTSDMLVSFRNRDS